MEAPNRGLHESELKSIQNELSAKHAEYQKLYGTRDNPSSGEIAAVKLKINTLKSIRKAKHEQLRSLSEELDHCKAEIALKAAAINEITRSTDIWFKNADDLDKAIRVKEKHFNAAKMSIKEEKDFVMHMDRLKRNQRKLGEYNAMVDERNLLNTKKEEIHQKRHALDREIRSIKREQPVLRRNLKALQDRVILLRSEINEICDRKSKMINVYNQKVDAWKKLAAWSKKVKQEEDDEDALEPFFMEKRICRTLIAYLEKYNVVEDVGDGSQDKDLNQQQPSSQPDSWSDADLTPTVSNASEFPVLLTNSSSDSADSILSEVHHVLLKKKDSDAASDILLSKQRKRVGKKEKRRGQALTHAADVYVEFDKLELLPPSTYGDVPSMLNTLKERLASYEEHTALPTDFDSTDSWHFGENESDLTDSAFSMSLSISDASTFSSNNNLTQSSFLEESGSGLYDDSFANASRRCTSGYTSPIEYDIARMNRVNIQDTTDAAVQSCSSQSFTRSQSESDIQQHASRRSRHAALPLSPLAQVSPAPVSSGICSRISESEFHSFSAAGCAGDEGIDAGKTESKDSSVNSDHAPIILLSSPATTSANDMSISTSGKFFGSESDNNTVKRRNYAKVVRETAGTDAS